MRSKSREREPIERVMEWNPANPSREILLNREWLVTNGLGGYSSGTVSGAVTRRYHGLLVAALPTPLGRVVMWSHVSETLYFGKNDSVSLGAEERAGGQLELKSAEYLREFRLEDGLPVWVYHVRDLVLEKRVMMPHLQNTVYVSYRILEGESRPRLELVPVKLNRRIVQQPYTEELRDVGRNAKMRTSVSNTPLRRLVRRDRRFLGNADEEGVELCDLHTGQGSRGAGGRQWTIPNQA